MATYVEQLKGYVKFLRGTPAAWATITAPQPDTLYFISEINADTGKLYLGNKLISDGSVSLSSYSLGDLSDILISEQISPNSILVYNTEKNQWEDKPLNTLLADIGIISMVGASQNNDGVAGLVPVPLAGQQNLFLRGDGNWANPVDSLFDTDEDKNKTIREIAQEEVATLLGEGDPEKLDTLKDVINWIETHDTIIDVEDAETRLVTLETAVFGQENQDNPEQSIPGLVNTVATLVTNVSTIETKQEELDNRLRWMDLVEEVDETI